MLARPVGRIPRFLRRSAIEKAASIENADYIGERPALPSGVEEAIATLPRAHLPAHSRNPKVAAAAAAAQQPIPAAQGRAETPESLKDILALSLAAFRGQEEAATPRGLLGQHQLHDAEVRFVAPHRLCENPIPPATGCPVRRIQHLCHS
jgi:hypothetical protein